MSTSKSSRPASSRSPAAIRPPTACSPKSRSANATCSAAASSAAPRCTYGQRARGFESVVRRAVFPRLPAGARHRRLRQADDSSSYYVLRHEDDRRRLPLRHSAARGSGAAAALFGLPAGDHAADQILHNCNNINPDFVRYVPDAGASHADRIRHDAAAGYTGLAELLRRRRSVAGGQQRTRAGRRAHVAGRLHLTYNTLDNNGTRPAASSSTSSRTSRASAAT